jgi:hypothetical protein
LLNVTVQVLEALAPRLVGLQASEDTSTGAIRLMVALAELLLYVAVTVALWSLGMAVVVALKAATVAAAGTVTEAGTLRFALGELRATVAPPRGAIPASATVHVELLELFNVAGRHVREATVGKTVAPPVTVPPVAKSRTAFPADEDAVLLLTPMAVVVTPAAMVRFTTATVPFEMMPAFIPEATQVYVPRVPEQFNALPGAVRAGPEFADIETTLADG